MPVSRELQEVSIRMEVSTSEHSMCPTSQQHPVPVLLQHFSFKVVRSYQNLGTVCIRNDAQSSGGSEALRPTHPHTRLLTFDFLIRTFVATQDFQLGPKRGIAQVPPNCSHPDLWGLVGTIFGYIFD